MVDQSTNSAGTPAPRREPNGPPVAGDHLTRYPLPEAAPWLGIAPNTLRSLINTGRLPRRFVSRLGGKVWMTGDQLAAAIAYTVQSDEPAAPAARRRRKRAAA
jgi:hypothetical protein